MRLGRSHGCAIIHDATGRFFHKADVRLARNLELNRSHRGRTSEANKSISDAAKLRHGTPLFAALTAFKPKKSVPGPTCEKIRQARFMSCMGIMQEKLVEKRPLSNENSYLLISLALIPK
jgi:hypothetical protein